MKKLMFYALALGILASCGNSKNANGILDENVLPGDTMIEIIGEWIEVPAEGDTNMLQQPKKVKFNKDNTMEGTPIVKKEKNKGIKNAADSITVTTMVYQLWDQQGDTLTMISQSAIDPQLQDTVTWGIVSLTGDSLKLNNDAQGTKNYVRQK